MIKAKLNLLIDALLALLLAAMAGLGFLMKWVLVPGFQRASIYGRYVELYWLGLDRHQWGTVHLYLGIAMLALMVLHVILHWSQVVGIYRRLIGSGGARVAVAILLVILILVLIAFPALVNPDVEESGRGRGQGEGGGHGRGEGRGRGGRTLEDTITVPDG